MNRDQDSMPAPKGGEGSAGALLAESRRKAELWDLVIRAHYLAHDMREACARASIAQAALGRVLSELLADWASEFGAALEQVEVARAVDRADARLRKTGASLPAATNDP
jgi:hypothetical protein